MPEKKGDGKFNAEEYMDVIMDGELFNRWKKGMEELGDLLIMGDRAGYYQGIASRRREQYQWQGFPELGMQILRT